MAVGIHKNLLVSPRAAHASSKPWGVFSPSTATPSIFFVTPSPPSPPSSSELALDDLDNMSTTAMKSPIQDDESSPLILGIRRARPLASPSPTDGRTKRLAHSAANRCKWIFHKLAKAARHGKEKPYGIYSASSVTLASSNTTELFDTSSGGSLMEVPTACSLENGMPSAAHYSSDVFNRSCPKVDPLPTYKIRLGKMLDVFASHNDLSKLRNRRAPPYSEELADDTVASGDTVLS